MKKISSLMIIGLLCMSTLAILAQQAKAEEWNVERITYGFLPSLIIDNQGRPHISYYDGSYLGYATRINDIWQIEVVDNRAGHIGQYSSMALDNNGNPHISYIDFHHYYQDEWSVMYASYLEGSWTLEEVDKVGSKQSTSLVIDSSDTPMIAYYDGINRDLKYAFKSGVSWVKETIDSGGDVGGGASLVLDSHENPRISYYDRSMGKLKYAERNDGSWNIQVIDSSAAAGWRSCISMGLDISDNPHMAYRSSAGVLKYVKWNGTLWIIETVVGDAVDELSLTVDPNGNPHIAYSTWGNLEYAVKDGDTWKTEIVSGDMGDAGLSLALNVDNRRINVAYEGITNNGDLNYVEGTYGILSPPVERTYRSIMIISPQNIVYHLNSIDLDYFVSVTTLWVGYSLDDQAIEILTGNIVIPGLKNGHHSITLFAMDVFGSMYEASVEFIVDANPAVLFTIPDEVRVSFQVGFWTPKTEFQIGEWVTLSLLGEWLSAGTHHAFASSATFVISDETGQEIWSRTLDHPIGGGWSSDPGGGWGIGVGWGQIDNSGNLVPAGTYYAGIRFVANPGFDFPEDHSDVLSFLTIDLTPPDAPIEVWVDDDFTLEDRTHFKSIQEAVDNVAWDGIVNVAPGTYHENVLIWKNIVVKSTKGASVTIIDGAERYGYATTVTFRRVTRAARIEGFTIKASGTSQSRGIQCHTFAHPVISHNLIISNSDHSNAYGIDIAGSSDPMIDHNTIIVSDTARFTGGICSYGGDPIVKNNIIVGDLSSQSSGIAVGNRAVPTIHTYNYYHNWQHAVREAWSGGAIDYPLGEGEIFSNTVSPGFVNSDEGDYHLREDSPCIGAGEDGTDIGVFPFAIPTTHEVAYITVRYNDDIDPDYTVNELKERADRITDYFLQQSFGEMNIRNDFVFDDWEPLSKSYAEYEQEFPDNWMARFRKIRDDAIELSGIVTRDYDAVVVVQPLNMRSFALLGARRVITTEDTPCTGGHAFSVWAHEIGHAIPDLAWHDYYRDPVFRTSGSIGYWGLMGRGTLMNPTAPVMSYNKVDAGWLEYNTIESEAYGEYPVDLLMNSDYGDNVYRYQTESGDIKYYIFEGRHPPDGVEQDPEWRHEFRLERDRGILVYEVTDEGMLYTIPYDHHENDRVTLLPGDSLSRVDSGVRFTAREVDSQLYIEIEELESTETTVVSLSTVTVTIDGTPIPEIQIEPDIDLHLYTPDGRHVGMDYASGEYMLQIEGAESSGNILAGGPEWIAIPDDLNFYIAIDPTLTRQWIEEDPLISPEDVSINACVQLAHYDESAIREESSPIPLDIEVEGPTILTRANVTKIFKPAEMSAKRRGAVMSRTNITNTGYLDISEITYEDEILNGWAIKDFDHTISVTLFIDNVKYKIPYEELNYVAVEDGLYVVYINFTEGIDLYQYDAVLDQYVYAMTIYAFETGWVLEIKYPMFPPRDLAIGEYSSAVSVMIVSSEGITARVEDTATLIVY